MVARETRRTISGVKLSSCLTKRKALTVEASKASKANRREEGKANIVVWWCREEENPCVREFQHGFVDWHELRSYYDGISIPKASRSIAEQKGKAKAMIASSDSQIGGSLSRMAHGPQPKAEGIIRLAREEVRPVESVM